MRDSRKRSTSRTARRLLAIAFLTTLGACTTTPPTAGSALPARTTPTATARYVPCAADPIISYNAPDPDHPVNETAANIYDTPPTISQIRKNNAARIESCGK